MYVSRAAAGLATYTVRCKGSLCLPNSTVACRARLRPSGSSLRQRRSVFTAPNSTTRFSTATAGKTDITKSTSSAYIRRKSIDEDYDFDTDKEAEPERLIEFPEDVIPQRPKIGIWINSTYKFGRVLVDIRSAIGRFVNVADFGPTAKKQHQVESHLRNMFYSHGIPVSQITSRLKEGGCFVFFPDVKSTNKAIETVHTEAYEGRPLDAFLVRGEPWFEDLVTLRPSPKIRIEHTGGPNVNLLPEDIFRLFRPYGKIVQLTCEKNVAFVTYVTKKSAISARNCLHNIHVNPTNAIAASDVLTSGKLQAQSASSGSGGSGGSNSPPPPPPPPPPVLRLRVSYEKWARFQYFQGLIDLMKSPRILPFVFLLCILCLLLMLEPFRLFNVTQTLALNWQEDYRKIPEDTIREPELEELLKIFSEKPSGIVVISGPEGGGKTTLLRKVLNGRRFAARIDYAGKFIGAEESALLENLEKAIGFTPSFSSINYALSFVESFLPMKQHGLGMTQQAQLNSMFNTLDKSLRIISTTFPADPKKPFDYPIIVFDGLHDLMSTGEKTSNLLNGLVKWAINTAQINNTAHIVFISDNIFAEEKLKQHQILRGRINSIHLYDLDRSRAKEFLSHGVTPKTTVSVDGSDENLSIFSVWGFVKFMRDYTSRVINVRPRTKEILTGPLPEEMKPDVDRAVEVLGGRLSDLEALIVRVRNGKTIAESVNEMVDDARKDILAKGYGGKFAVSTTGKKWTKSQLWRTMKMCAKDGQVEYYKLLDSVFEGDEEPLQGLVQENILGLRVDVNSGLETRQVTAASPLFQNVFKSLKDEEKFKKRMEKIVADEAVGLVKKDIASVEDELQKLAKSSVSSTGRGITNRQRVLTEKLEALNEKLSQVEREYANELKK